VSAAVAGCGSAPRTYYDTTPVRFSVTTTTPTVTVPTPSQRPTLGPEGVPVETGPFLASATTTELGALVDGVQCQSLGQFAYTAYAHLQVYVNGSSRALPGGIGLVDMNPNPTPHGLVYGFTTCQYWLHTKAADGIIQIQSPVPGPFTLGQLFEIWDQPLGVGQVAGFRGPVTVLVNGERWRGAPQNVPLAEHADIELAVGKPVPSGPAVNWLGTGF
jgi:hypothetical protein